MLEAYFKDKSLTELESRLPQDVEDVIQELHAHIGENPADTRALYILARCQLTKEQPEEANRTLETLLSHEPDHAIAKIELAKLRFQDGKSAEAVRLLTQVTSLRPEIAGAWSLLAEYLQHDAQIAASEDAQKQFDMVRKFNEQLFAAEQLFARGDFKTADGICRQLLQLVPNEVRVLRLLARIARQFGHFEFSTTTLARCVETRPRDAGIGLDYAYSLLASRAYEEALAQCENVIELAPEILAIYDLKAEVLFFLGRYEEAIAVYRAMSEATEKKAPRLLHLGKVLKTIGQVPDATACYQEAMATEPTLGQSYWELADLKTYRFSDDEVGSMRQLLDDSAVKPLDRVMIGFALGKALEDSKEFEESFRHYQSANDGYKRMRPSTYARQSEQFSSFFAADYFSDREGRGSDSDAPIFIVSLPRSGSTLLEQILSSHSMVDATQELDEIVSIARAVNKPGQSQEDQYPWSLAKLDANETQSLAQRYLDFAQQYRQQAPYFVDKAPHNFLHVGLIKTLFPKAKIIDIRRDPMASGWSLYRQFFADSYWFSYDLETIGEYYKDYLALMDHWHAVLPDQVLTIRYEDLVNDLPATVNTVLEYCGLPFEQGCLDFHLNERAVATPSSEQVRQPLYSDALEHWKNYEAFLGPLKQAIDG